MHELAAAYINVTMRTYSCKVKRDQTYVLAMYFTATIKWFRFGSLIHYITANLYAYYQFQLLICGDVPKGIENSKNYEVLTETKGMFANEKRKSKKCE